MIDHADFLLALYDNGRSLHDDPIQPIRYAEEKRKEIILIHPDTAAELEKMLLMLKDEGEEAAFEYVKKWLKEK